MKALPINSVHPKLRGRPASVIYPNVKGPLIIQNTQRGHPGLGLMGRGNFTSSASLPSPSRPSSSSASHRTGAAPHPTPRCPPPRIPPPTPTLCPCCAQSSCPCGARRHTCRAASRDVGAELPIARDVYLTNCQTFCGGFLSNERCLKPAALVDKRHLPPFTYSADSLAGVSQGPHLQTPHPCAAGRPPLPTAAPSVRPPIPCAAAPLSPPKGCQSLPPSGAQSANAELRFLPLGVDLPPPPRPPFPPPGLNQPADRPSPVPIPPHRHQSSSDGAAGRERRRQLRCHGSISSPSAVGHRRLR